MRGRFRPPMFVIGAALIGLMALLATLQYQWLGRISAAERDSRRSTLSARAAAFASDFDKELTAAYMLFQLEPSLEAVRSGENLASRLATRYDRWQATSRFPRLIKDYYVAARADDGAFGLQRFNPSTRFVEPVEWPGTLTALRREIDKGTEHTPGKPDANGTFLVRMLIAPLWDEVPALVVPMPLMMLNGSNAHSTLKFSPAL